MAFIELITPFVFSWCTYSRTLLVRNFFSGPRGCCRRSIAKIKRYMLCTLEIMFLDTLACMTFKRLFMRSYNTASINQNKKSAIFIRISKFFENYNFAWLYKARILLFPLINIYGTNVGSLFIVIYTSRYRKKLTVKWQFIVL